MLPISLVAAACRTESYVEIAKALDAAAKKCGVNFIGGFGALVFQGLLSSALDLVLLGVVPTIALAVVVDALFALWGAWLKGEAND